MKSKEKQMKLSLFNSNNGTKKKRDDVYSNLATKKKRVQRRIFHPNLRLHNRIRHARKGITIAL